ncbi:PIN domain-containing protein [Candidatus Bathyarchaeota archaeon]|nr:PIN domain-containing protein [Candidatus Bathyarchaeota archaeon]
MAYIEGVVDVSIIVPTCFENPLKRLAADFLAGVLTQKNRAVIPVTSIIGSYHIATRYLQTPRLAVKKVLEGILGTKSTALYPHATPEVASDALDYAAVYNIEPWDGYLIALTRSLGAKIVYSLDEELSKVKEVSVSNPFPRDKLDEFHTYIRDKLGERDAKADN